MMYGALGLFLLLSLIGLCYSARDVYRDWKAKRELQTYLARVEMMRRWKS
jgi:hypothetical protein